jgi:hypothetical protein
MQELLVNPGWIDAGFDPELLVGDLVHYHSATSSQNG